MQPSIGLTMPVASLIRELTSKLPTLPEPYGTFLFPDITQASLRIQDNAIVVRIPALLQIDQVSKLVAIRAAFRVAHKGPILLLQVSGADIVEPGRLDEPMPTADALVQLTDLARQVPQIEIVRGLSVELTASRGQLPQGLIAERSASTRLHIVEPILGILDQSAFIVGGVSESASNAKVRLLDYQQSAKYFNRTAVPWRAGREAIFVHGEAIATRLQRVVDQMGLSIAIPFEEHKRIEERPVGAIPPKIRCKKVGEKPTCDRDKACPPRKLRKKIVKPVKKIRKVTTTICNKTFGKLGKLVGKLVCRPVERAIEVTEDATEFIVEQIADTACIAVLNKCTLKWKAYETIGRSCNVALTATAQALKALDFDRIGDFSADFQIRGLATASKIQVQINTDSAFEFAVSARVEARAQLEGRLNFSPKLAVLGGCLPTKWDARSYQLMAEVGQLSGKVSIEQLNGALVAGLSVMQTEVQIKAESPPLLHLVKSNIGSTIKCPLVGIAAGVVEIAGLVLSAADIVKYLLKGEAQAPKGWRSFLTGGRLAHSLERRELGHFPLRLGAIAYGYPSIEGQYVVIERK